MIKLSTFSHTELGPPAVPLFGPADSYFEKTASAHLLPEVRRYIDSLKPSNNSQYVLVNAMGATEWYGSNVNADAFSEPSLIHKPSGWSNDHVRDAVLAKDWPYGFPTFYVAKPFAHHRNKDPLRGFGDVELATWNDHMKRVELVTRIDHDKCHAFGGEGAWEKIQRGEFPDVSMGTKVPWDRCSICTDMDIFREAKATFDPKRHADPGKAILEFHRKLKEKNGRGIPGISITRADYCECMKERANKILPDGRKVWVWNDYPRFFDISFVFIGADRTAKTMLKIAGGGKKHFFIGYSSDAAEKVGYQEMPGEKTAFEITGVFMVSKEAAAPGTEFHTEESLKTASVDELLGVLLFGKIAKDKKSEITKQVVPAPLAAKGVPLFASRERKMEKPVLDKLAELDIDVALSTLGGMGVVLRPSEFQYLALTKCGHRDLAAAYDKAGVVFSHSSSESDVPMSLDRAHDTLSLVLWKTASERSAFAPYVEDRFVLASRSGDEDQKMVWATSSLTSDLLHKMGSAYNGYRHRLMDFFKTAPAPFGEIAKTASGQSVTPLSMVYAKHAFWEEVPGGASATTPPWRRDLPSETT